ncbi:MAG: hypothetical protein ABIP51_20155 [Bacteroidia bacterium]
MEIIQKIRNVLSRNTSNIHNAVNLRRESVINSSDFNIVSQQLERIFKEELKESSKQSLFNSLKSFEEKNVLPESSKQLLINFIKFTNNK